MDYTSLTASRDLVIEKTGLQPTDLDTLLAISAGTRPGEATPFYRPYFVCAALLDTALHTRKLLKGEGAEFDKPDLTIQGFLDLQAAIDRAEQLEVPPGMEATYRQPVRTPARVSKAVPTRPRW